MALIVHDMVRVFLVVISSFILYLVLDKYCGFSMKFLVSST